MIKKLGFCIMFILTANLIWSQSQEVLLKIDGEPVYKSEFDRLFSKNANLLSENEQKDIDKNLDLFIDYNLKIKEAKSQGLDTLPTFFYQFNKFRKETANKYLYKTDVSKKLLHEAYDRMKKERNVDYILIVLNQNHTPQDTLKAYQKALKFKEEVENGGDFNRLAQRFSEDPSVKENKGNLGWLKVFTTVYEFENAAYDIEIGEISEPFRSPYGYHVIRVNEERQREGKISVAHILLKAKNDKAWEKEGEEKIHNLYKKLTEEDAVFADLARQYSEDPATAKIGGKMRKFSRGETKYDKFEEEVFKLNKDNPLSKPFKTEVGWHLVKFLDFQPIGSFEQEKKELAELIKRNNRSLIIRDSLIAKLQKKYEIKSNKPGLDYFTSKVKEEDFIKKMEADLPSGKMIEIADTNITYEYFYKRLRNLKSFRPQPFTPESVKKNFEDLKNLLLIEQAQNDLINENEEYANEVGDYRDGMLIYDLIDRNVLQKSDDTIALQNFYKENKSEFIAPEKYEMSIVSGSNKKDVNKARKYLKKGKSDEEIKKISPDLIIHKGIFEAEDSQIPQNFKKTNGISSVHKENGVYMVSKTENVIPAKQQSFDQIKGKVVSKYQAKLESDFMSSLHKKHQIEINEEVLNRLKN